MSNPPEDRVRAILSAILAAMGTEAPGLLAILDELRFLARGLLGRDSTGATQVGPSIWTILDEALWMNEPDGFGNTVRISLIQYLRLRLGDTAAATMVDGFAGTLGALGAIRSDLLYDEVLPNRTLGQQVESVRFNLQELGSTVANLENVLLGIQSISDRSSLLLSQVAPLAEGNDIYSALIAIKDESARMADCCEGDSGFVWPQPDVDCSQGGTLVAVMYPTGSDGTATTGWDVQIEPGVTSWMAILAGQSEGIRYSAGASGSAWFYVQLSDIDILSPGGGAWGLQPRIIDLPEDPPARPDISINNFAGCTDTYTIYAESTNELESSIAYVPYLDLGLSGGTPSASTVRILMYSAST